MITLIVLALLGLAVAAKNNPNGPTQQTPVIKDAIGGALTGVLGSRARPADYYASGNPQYNNTTPPRVPYRPRPVSQNRKPTVTTAKSKVVPVLNVAGTSQVQRISGGQTKPVLAAFVNTRQVSRSTTAPEISQPFWARRFPTT